MLAAFDEARSVLDPNDDETLWDARQHVLDLVAHSTALDTGELDVVRFRALADADALEAFAELDAINRVGKRGVRRRHGGGVPADRTGSSCSSVRCSSAPWPRRCSSCAISAGRSTFRSATSKPGLEQFVVDGLGHRIEVTGDREFRSVAGVVNTMAARLEDSLAELAHKAFHDPLTGLANRTQLERRLEPSARVDTRIGGTHRSERSSCSISTGSRR